MLDIHLFQFRPITLYIHLVCGELSIFNSHSNKTCDDTNLVNNFTQQINLPGLALAAVGIVGRFITTEHSGEGVTSSELAAVWVTVREQAGENVIMMLENGFVISSVLASVISTAQTK